MTTTVTSRIGHNYPTAREYPGPEEWLATEPPADFTSADEAHIVEFYNDDDLEFEIGPGDNPLFMEFVTDATRNLIWRCAPGHSLFDNIVPGTDAVNYDPTKGVAIRNVSHRGNPFLFNVNYFLCQGIQTCSGWNGISTSSIAGGVDGVTGFLTGIVEKCLCLMTNNSGGINVSGTTHLRNCFAIASGGGGNLFTGGAGEFSPPGRIDNCVGIAVAGVTASLGLAANASNICNLHVRNLAVFGCTAAIDSTFSAQTAGSFDYITTSAASVSFATNKQTSKTAAAQFVSATASLNAPLFIYPDGLDLSLLGTADLIGFGESDPADGAFSDDAFGTSRGATWDSGAQQFGAGGGTSDGAGSVSGTGTASGVGASTAASVASASGVGAAAAVGRATAEAVGAAAGAGAAAATGAATAAATASATATGNAAGVGASIAAAVGSAAGASDAIAVAAPLAVAVGSATGAGDATGVGAATAEAVGAAAGISTASGVAADGSVGAADGISSASGVGASIAAGVGSSDGISAAAGVGASTAASVGSSDGVGTSAGIGQAIAEAVGASDGISTVAGVGAAIAEAVGASSGTGIAAAVSNSTGTAEGVGTADGVASVAGVGASIAAAVGSADATSSASAEGTGIAAAVGSAASLSGALGFAASIAAAVGGANAIGLALAVSDSEPIVSPGGRTLRVRGDGRTIGVAGDRRTIRPTV